jgi:CDP-diacylglycerol--glycerol-3-phosphate 3-phosphatidyltransferase
LGRTFERLTDFVFEYISKFKTYGKIILIIFKHFRSNDNFILQNEENHQSGTMQKLTLIPMLISSLRIVALPLFFYVYNIGNAVVCLGLLGFCAATDFLDGYIARKLNVTSNFGAYYDATTDFIFMIGIFLFFYNLGFYPIWLLLIITFAFIQFIITSYLAKTLYDPVGRYLGSALYIGVVLTLFWPTDAVFAFVQYAFVVFFLVSIASRIISLTRKRTKQP